MGNAKLRVENAAHLGALLSRRLMLTNAANLAEPTAETVSRLQSAARTLHRNAERACNEDCGCPRCDGYGYTVNKANGARRGMREDCPACAGTGQTFGKREAGIMRRLRAALAPYRLHVYKQGDPRGWPLYLIPEERIPAADTLRESYTYASDNGHAEPDALRARWVASNYNSAGVAVCPH